MRRLLYVTPVPPSLKGGGGLHCYANLRALCAYPDLSVDYVGPPIEETLFGLDTLRVKVARRYRFADKVYAAATGSASSLAGLFRELGQKPGAGYTAAFVEYSKAGFVLRALAGGPLTICSVHNVEADYMGRNSSGSSKLAAANIRRSEATSLRFSDHVLVLHSDDRARLIDLYDCGGLRAKAHLHPVCTNEPSETLLPFRDRERIVLIPGSLHQMFNERGIIDFLDACWPKLGDLGLRLVVAGSHPRPVLKDLVKRAGGTLIENPESMAAVMRRAMVVLVPDPGGAGMKLRVAEALSLGVPVIGTRAGLLGYADAPTFGRVVGSIADIAPAIRELAEDDAMVEELGIAARNAWQRNYCYPVFEARLHKNMDAWLEGAS